MQNNRFYKWELLVWLWLAFFFNQADRQIFNVALPLIKADLQLTDTQLGLVGSLFALTLGVCIPFAGLIGDLFDRKKIIVYSLSFWSIATLFTGFSNSLLHLVLLRSLAVGGGEAFYAPAANGLIGHYHQKTRGVAMAIHQTSVYVGVIMSGGVGGYIAQTFGWKNTFYLFGGAGVVLAAILWVRLKPIAVIAPQLRLSEQKKFIRASVGAILKSPSALLLCPAFLAMVFVNVGYTVWMPTFLHEKFDLSVAEAGFNSMFYHHIFAFVGVMGGGFLSDKLAHQSEKKRLIVQASGMLLAVPFIYGMGQATTAPTTYFFLAAFGLFRGMYEANIYATLFAVIAPKYRSTSVGLSAMFAYVIAALVPVVLGHLKSTIGLSNSLSGLCAAYLIGGLCLWAAFRFSFEKDHQSVKTEEK
ncbi:MAG: MFS transporter [Runella zeae]